MGTADIRNNLGASIVRSHLHKGTAVRIAKFRCLNRAEQFERLTIEDCDRSHVITDPEFFPVGRKNDVIGLTQPIGTRKLLADNGHGVGINCRERSALLPIAAFAFVGDVGDLFIR